MVLKLLPSFSSKPELAKKQKTAFKRYNEALHREENGSQSSFRGGSRFASPRGTLTNHNIKRERSSSIQGGTIGKSPRNTTVGLISVTSKIPGPGNYAISDKISITNKSQGNKFG